MDNFFFFDDAARIGEYVKARCADELKEAIEVADLMADNTILFKQRWDMEKTYTPVVFGDEIDWLHQPGDDPEWTFAANRMRAWVPMGQIYAVTGDEKYPQAFVRQMVHWVKTVKREDEKAANAWRTIEAGIRLENWLKTFEYMKVSELVTDEVTAVFRASVTEHAEFLMTVWNPFNLMSNWGVLANHGLFMAGCMLPQSGRTKEYVRESVSRLESAAKIQVYPDGVHWEQSPLYHNEVLRCFLDVNILARRCDIALAPVITEKTHAMLRASLLAGKPDGNQIMMGDSDDIDQRDLLSMGAYLFKDGNLKFGGYERLDFDSCWNLGIEAALEYEAIAPIKPNELTHEFADSGNYYVRSDWGADAVFLHFHCGTLGAGHGHGDKLHFDLFARGEDIFIDPGRYTYVPDEDRYYYKKPAAHNTITADGHDLYACADSWLCTNLSRAVSQKFIRRDKYVYMEGGHLGYMDIGVYVCRRLIQIQPDILLICDTFYDSGGKERTYRQYFQWNNQGKVDGAGMDWSYQSEKNIARLTLLCEHGMDTELLSGRISRHYNLQEDTRRLAAKVTAAGFVSIFAVIALDDPKSGPEIFTVTKEAVHSNFKHIVFPTRDIEAVTITKGAGKYTVVLAHREYASPTDTFTADGCVGFGHAVVFDRNEAQSAGTVLMY